MDADVVDIDIDVVEVDVDTGDGDYDVFDGLAMEHSEMWVFQWTKLSTFSLLL